MTQYQALPTDTPDEVRIEMLQQAERRISTQTLFPVPTNPANFLTVLTPKHTAFSSRKNNIEAELQASIPHTFSSYGPN